MNSNVNPMNRMDDATQAAQEMARSASRAGPRAGRTIAADVEDLIKRVAHLDDAAMARTRAKLEHTLGAAKVSLHDGTRRMKRTARHAADATDRYVHWKPWSAIGIAAGAGAAIALLLSTRMYRRAP